MKQLIKLLQHPLIKIIVFPFSFISFGLITGITMTSEIQWLNIGLLYLIVTMAHLIEHFFFIKYSRKQSNAAPAALLYFCEVIMLASAVMFFLQQHLIINILLSMYLIFIHLQWFPYNMTGTFYHYLLNVFFHGFILNVIAFYTQTNGITSPILYAIVPVVLFNLGSQLELTRLKQLLAKANISVWLKSSVVISFIFALIAIVLGVYYSIPSSSYYLVQITFILFSLLSILPTLVITNQIEQAQNKINYYSSITLIFTVLYALSYIF